MCAIATAGQGAGAIAPNLERAAERLRAAGVELPRLDAELLMAWAAGVERAHLIAREVEMSRDAVARFESALARRERREPIAYITGIREFHSLDFEVSPAVLIPRPETETLVDAAVRFLGERPGARVLDIGTGSGAIAISIAYECPRVRTIATDISADALEIARRNANRHGVADRIEFRRADLFEPQGGGAPLGSFDLIVSNPPYIEDAAIASLQPEVRDYEPRAALEGGADGLGYYRRIAADARGHLAPGGALMVEVGAGQAEAVRTMFADAGMRGLDVINDLSAAARVVIARS
jgi:release factor glutamine methyltransferase